jgi:hypothetical protein
LAIWLKGRLKDRHLMLDAEAHVRVLVEGPVARRVKIGRL